MRDKQTSWEYFTSSKILLVKESKTTKITFLLLAIECIRMPNDIALL